MSAAGGSTLSDVSTGKASALLLFVMLTRSEEAQAWLQLPVWQDSHHVHSYNSTANYLLLPLLVNVLRSLTHTESFENEINLYRDPVLTITFPLFMLLFRLMDEQLEPFWSV